MKQDVVSKAHHFKSQFFLALLSNYNLFSFSHSIQINKTCYLLSHVHHLLYIRILVIYFIIYVEYEQYWAKYKPLRHPGYF